MTLEPGDYNSGGRYFDADGRQLVKGLLEGDGDAPTLTEQLIQTVLLTSIDERYSEKSAAVARLTTSGPHTIVTPAAGKALVVFWVSAIPDPDALTSPYMEFAFAGGGDLYAVYAVAHWQKITGGIDQSLICTLDQPGDVAVTVHYEETP